MTRGGIDYFPLDVALDSKFELIEAEFGLTGFGVVVHLLQEIYGKEGYYIEWTEEVALLFGHKVGVGGSVVSEIVEASIRRGMFDKEIYDKYRVLTSRGIQKRYFEAVSRRKNLEVDYNILLVNAAQIAKNASIQAVNVNILSENADISGQSKVKESKGEERRVKESKGDVCAEPQAASTPPVILLPLNDGTEYPVSQEQCREWEGLYPAVDVIQQLRNMKGWIDANPARRKTLRGIKAFIVTWLGREQDKGGVYAAPSSSAVRTQAQPQSGTNNVFLQLLKGGANKTDGH